MVTAHGQSSKPPCSEKREAGATQGISKILDSMEGSLRRIAASKNGGVQGGFNRRPEPDSRLNARLLPEDDHEKDGASELWEESDLESATVVQQDEAVAGEKGGAPKRIMQLLGHTWQRIL